MMFVCGGQRRKADEAIGRSRPGGRSHDGGFVAASARKGRGVMVLGWGCSAYSVGRYGRGYGGATVDDLPLFTLFYYFLEVNSAIHPLPRGVIDLPGCPQSAGGAPSVL